MAKDRDSSSMTNGADATPSKPAKRVSLKDLVRMRCGTGETVPDDEEARRRWPTLWHLLTERYPDATHILEPARITIQMGVGCWMVSVRHPDLRVGLEAYSDTLGGALDAWEAMAADPSTRWKGWGKGDVTLRKRKKQNSD